MKSQVVHTVWSNTAGEAAGNIWHWSLLGVRGLIEPFHRICGSVPGSYRVHHEPTPRDRQEITAGRREHAHQLLQRLELENERVKSHHGNGRTGPTSWSTEDQHEEAIQGSIDNRVTGLKKQGVSSGRLKTF